MIEAYCEFRIADLTFCFEIRNPHFAIRNLFRCLLQNPNDSPALGTSAAAGASDVTAASALGGVEISSTFFFLLNIFGQSRQLRFIVPAGPLFDARWCECEPATSSPRASS